MQTRRANIASEQHQHTFQLNREPISCEDNLNSIPTFDDLDVIAKLMKFYDDLNSLQSNSQCLMCQEQFPFIAGFGDCINALLGTATFIVYTIETIPMTIIHCTYTIIYQYQYSGSPHDADSICLVLNTCKHKTSVTVSKCAIVIITK